MSILEFEKSYCKVLEKQPEQLDTLYRELTSHGKISLSDLEITKPILLRMKAYYEVQDKIKEFLNKRYSPPASDFFVEAVSFYLKAVLDTHNTGLEVHSERQIKQKRGAIRPDISIWEGEDVFAIIECKTQLGWNRRFDKNQKKYKWEIDFTEREGKLRREFPKAQAFLLVLTEENWDGFQDDDPRVRKQFFALLHKTFWPTQVTEENIEGAIKTPIEGLFKKILILADKEENIRR